MNIKEIWSNLKGWQKGIVLGIIFSLLYVVSLKTFIFLQIFSGISILLFLLVPQLIALQLLLIFILDITIYALFGWLFWDKKNKTVARALLVINLLVGAFDIFILVSMS
jgi:hypothetical protein